MGYSSPGHKESDTTATKPQRTDGVLDRSVCTLLSFFFNIAVSYNWYYSIIFFIRELLMVEKVTHNDCHSCCL